MIFANGLYSACNHLLVLCIPLSLKNLLSLVFPVGIVTRKERHFFCKVSSWIMSAVIWTMCFWQNTLIYHYCHNLNTYLALAPTGTDWTVTRLRMCTYIAETIFNYIHYFRLVWYFLRAYYLILYLEFFTIIWNIYF